MRGFQWVFPASDWSGKERERGDRAERRSSPTSNAEFRRCQLDARVPSSPTPLEPLAGPYQNPAAVPALETALTSPSCEFRGLPKQPIVRAAGKARKDMNARRRLSKAKSKVVISQRCLEEVESCVPVRKKQAFHLFLDYKDAEREVEVARNLLTLCHTHHAHAPHGPQPSAQRVFLPGRTISWQMSQDGGCGCLLPYIWRGQRRHQLGGGDSRGVTGTRLLKQEWIATLSCSRRS